MRSLLDEGQREIAREIADAWLGELVQPDGRLWSTEEQVLGHGEDDPRRLRLVVERGFARRAERDGFFARALATFTEQPERVDRLEHAPSAGQSMRYRYARAVRQSDVERLAGRFEPTLPPRPEADPLVGVVLIDMNAEWAQTQMLLNRVYITIAGLIAMLLAIVVFWFITMRIILGPVRVLRSTAEKVSEGDLNTRADINTGDEYEQLSDAFNEMLANLKASQEQLQQLNRQLDVKVDELAQTNVSLHEANRLKTDFLANVSHELKTPLNSIIGFAELLSEAIASGKPLEDKHRRYVDNIAQSSRALLTMINELLDLAKIEAGRIDLNVESVSVSDACEALASLIRPQAEGKQLDLRVRVRRTLPLIKTDVGKLQQILFNFLSNAVKFTPPEGRVELTAEAETDAEGQVRGVRISVTDTGPGISIDHQEEIFEKFRQLDDSHTKQHAGTGLGLAISRELAKLLEGRIELDSDVGRGATFTLVIPRVLAAKSQALMPDLSG
jgi:signal transduction histidine kinase